LKNNETRVVLNGLENTINNTITGRLPVTSYNPTNSISSKSLDNLQNLFENQNTHNPDIVFVLKDLYKIIYLLSLHKSNYNQPSIFSRNINTPTNIGYIKPDNK